MAELDLMSVGTTLGRGLLAGVGLRASGMVGNLVSDGDGPDLAGGFGNVVVGAGVDIGGDFAADSLGRDMGRWVNAGTEGLGTGIQAAGWDELGEAAGITASNQARVVEVTESSASGSPTSSQARTSTVGGA